MVGKIPERFHQKGALPGGGGDAKGRQMGVHLQLLGIQPPVFITLQQQGGKVGEKVDGTVNLHLPSLAVCIDQGRVASEIPLGGVQAEIGEDFPHRDFLPPLCRQVLQQGQAVIGAAHVFTPVTFGDVHGHSSSMTIS